MLGDAFQGAQVYAQLMSLTKVHGGKVALLGQAVKLGGKLLATCLKLAPFLKQRWALPVCCCCTGCTEQLPSAMHAGQLLLASGCRGQWMSLHSMQSAAQGQQGCASPARLATATLLHRVACAQQHACIAHQTACACRFAGQQEDVLAVVRKIQAGNKLLQVLCAESKVLRAGAVSRSVPATKQALERFLFSMKQMFHEVRGEGGCEHRQGYAARRPIQHQWAVP